MAKWCFPNHRFSNFVALFINHNSLYEPVEAERSGGVTGHTRTVRNSEFYQRVHADIRQASRVDGDILSFNFCDVQVTYWQFHLPSLNVFHREQKLNWNISSTIVTKYYFSVGCQSFQDPKYRVWCKQRNQDSDLIKRQVLFWDWHELISTDYSVFGDTRKSNFCNFKWHPPRRCGAKGSRVLLPFVSNVTHIDSITIFPSKY